MLVGVAVDVLVERKHPRKKGESDMLANFDLGGGMIKDEVQGLPPAGNQDPKYLDAPLLILWLLLLSSQKVILPYMRLLKMI